MEFELLVGLVFTMEGSKGLSHCYILDTVLWHTCTSHLALLIQTTVHKMAALTVLFTTFKHLKRRKSWVDRFIRRGACDASLVKFPFNQTSCCFEDTFDKNIFRYCFYNCQTTH